MDLNLKIAQELNLKREQVENVDKLLAEGNTIPFIARYRKEATGELDEVKLREVDERLAYLKNLAARKDEVNRLIAEQGKLTPEIESNLLRAELLQQVEAIYLPFRPKRRTKATIAKEKGLEPLADYLAANPRLSAQEAAPEAARFISEERGVVDVGAALDGAKDILAERISETFAVREAVRHFLRSEAVLCSKAVAEQPSVYEMYYAYSEPVRKIPPHRVLAINRGEREEVLKVTLEYTEEKVHHLAALKFPGAPAGPDSLMLDAIRDGCKRLLLPSIERKMRSSLSVGAEEHAIKVFGQNLKQLLLLAPVKGKTFLAIDPAYRTGCKVAVVGPTGKVLATAVSYFTPPQNDRSGGTRLILKLIETHGVQAVTIGNGTGSRESEDFIANLIREHNLRVSYTIVNEAGASVYSASELAGKELPELDVTLRGAVSIGRRVLDPLAELVKIDPKAIGVGQYQHDVDQKQLADKLTGVVEDCVNSVGVDLNTASPALLRYVAGVTPTVAKNIVAFRDEHGIFAARAELKKVPRLGPATYTQCAGFLRVPAARNILDNTPVHPESYELAERFLAMVGDLGSLSTGRVHLSEEALAKAAQELGAGLPTLRDIYQALRKPGRGPREDVAGPVFRSDVLQMEDLAEGMVLTGVVRNVIDFGAFVDIGVKQDGLVHISEISDKFIKHPSEALAVGDVVKVRILSVDPKHKRIGLSLKGIDAP
ncbi:MAG: 30S ribosomal protein S1 [Firmicutes bacterium]|nr:30S ribosomal protein S1 [Bacillota bacterium]